MLAFGDTLSLKVEGRDAPSPYPLEGEGGRREPAG